MSFSGSQENRVQPNSNELLGNQYYIGEISYQYVPVFLKISNIPKSIIEGQTTLEIRSTDVLKSGLKSLYYLKALHSLKFM